MQKGAIIGTGRTAEVYEWGQDKVLKLYYDWVPKDWVDSEIEIGYSIYKAGVSSPAIYDIVELEGRNGIAFQRINGKTMLKLIEARPWKGIYFAHHMARLHVEIHSCIADKLPSQKEKLTYAIKDLSKMLGDKEKIIIDYLNSLPSGVSVCHGDFHPDNIIVSNKESVVIDWTNAYSGNPLGDVARTCLMINAPSIPPGISKGKFIMLKVAKRLVYSAYLKEYIKLSRVKYASIDAWILPIAAARLRENIPGEEKWLIDTINKRLESIS